MNDNHNLNGISNITNVVSQMAKAFEVVNVPIIATDKMLAPINSAVQSLSGVSSPISNFYQQTNAMAEMLKSYTMTPTVYRDLVSDVIKSLDSMRYAISETNLTIRQAVAANILTNAERGWLTFDIVTNDLVLDYIETLGIEDEDDFDLDIDELSVWVIKKHRIADMIGEIQQSGLVNGAVELDIMLDALDKVDNGHKILFQYVMSLIDSALLNQRKKFGDFGLKGLTKYNDKKSIIKTSKWVSETAERLDNAKYISGLKTKVTISLLSTFYNDDNGEIQRNEFMHGNANYDNLTEIKFYQLFTLLYQIAVGVSFVELIDANIE
ncbi:hypothetical protein C6P12_08335 [Weissella confusa]|uniref:hypothetical protein n=1 Tax=Weissella confusa TaxID=1583 RepID=UPI00107F6759|nr:hypothetical protein [Weissella confusa]TGE64065.1 hypothetical protein C6P12_08335 [Weissella confusa]